MAKKVYFEGQWIDVSPGVILIDRRGRQWTVCGDCEQLIQVNKPIIGSLHMCS